MSLESLRIAQLQALRSSIREEMNGVLAEQSPRVPLFHGVGALLFLTMFGCAMFVLGGVFSVYQNGVSLPVFARQAPENFDRAVLHPRQTEERGASQAPPQTLHTAPAEQQESTSSSRSSSALSSEASSSMSVEEGIPPGESPSPSSASSESSLASSVEPVEPFAPGIPIPFESIFSSAASSSAPAEKSSSAAAEPAPVPPVPPPAAAPPLAPAEIGVFFTQTSVKNDRYFVQTLERLRMLPGSALVFNVKAGKVFYHSAAPSADELDLIVPAYDLPEVIRQAHERGVRTIGRFVALKDPNLAQALPETQIKHPRTLRSVGSVWVDGANTMVLEHNEQILRELVAAGIDEINLDYIRYPTEYAQASVGLTGSEKADHIEAFLRMARRVIDENGGKTKLGISTYAILGWNFPVNFEPLGQDIARFAPLVDVISPMAYPATFAAGSYYNPAKHPGSRMYYLVYRTLTGYRELLGDQAYKLRPWIQGYGITQKNLKDQIQAVFDSGSCGFTIWNASNEYGMFFKMLSDVRRPEQCTQ